MGVLIVLYLGGIVAYFLLTTERQRENYLLVAWVLLALPVVVRLVRLLLDLLLS